MTWKDFGHTRRSSARELIERGAAWNYAGHVSSRLPGVTAGGIHIVPDLTMPPGEISAQQDGKVVGRIVDVGQEAIAQAKAWLRKMQGTCHPDPAELEAIQVVRGLLAAAPQADALERVADRLVKYVADYGDILNGRPGLAFIVDEARRALSTPEAPHV